MFSSAAPFISISSLKMECEKLASEKIEIQRHYVMVRGRLRRQHLLFCVQIE
jgi:hypothetical protein